MPAYIEPQCLINDKYRRNMKSDVYSLGVILWEISSGRPPFPCFESVLSLAIHIFKGNREEPIKGTPLQYIKLYKQCWDNDPADRPETRLIFNTLKQINPNETLIQHPIKASAQFFEDLRREALVSFEQGKFLKALELFEEILKSCQLSPEDQVSVTAWDLSRNRGFENFKEGKALADTLCKNSTLTKLNLRYNKLGSEGGKALADALCKNFTLTSLNLENNNLDSEGGKALADALCKNSMLTELYIYENNIGFKLISNLKIVQ
ncbi:kinase-like protein [Gigaspora margarita]|uniref:Kinase-like protein n=1 Tax=Gigaspora margarita TaxID=4874 RepID=A0A8H4AT21_GIGMA|nr:kinase-like protein [Gigaspora margarita]